MCVNKYQDDIADTLQQSKPPYFKFGPSNSGEGRSFWGTIVPVLARRVQATKPAEAIVWKRDCDVGGGNDK